MNKKRSLIIFTAVILIFAVYIGPAAAYANYEYIWTSSGNQFLEEDSISGIDLGPDHYEDYYYFSLMSSHSTVLLTPFVNSINKNGVHPKVRYLWFALKMPTGVNAVHINVYNGPNNVYSHSLNWAGTGAYKEYMIDMGSYKDMNRGINTGLNLQNTGGTGGGVETYGAGAKEEW
jgi:hypothetical protein